jgi:hypothetical protein
MPSDIPIKIEGFTGGPNGGALKKCFFRETERGLFLLFSSDMIPIETEPKPVPNGFPFTFSYQEKEWTVTFVYSEFTGIGAGIWSAVPTVPHTGHDGDVDDPESGTFQAQNGPSASYDLEASASASA